MFKKKKMCFSSNMGKLMVIRPVLITMRITIVNRQVKKKLFRKKVPLILCVIGRYF